MIEIISYNVNGIRAAGRKGFLDWLKSEGPDVVCIQETKAQEDQLDAETLNPDGYRGFWHSAQKKGYSGTAILSKIEPEHVELGTGIDYIDAEGRVIRADFKNFSLMCVYFPSGSAGDHRQQAKDLFLKDFPGYVEKVRKEHPQLIISGDYNIAHTEIDIHDPKGNKNNSGFLPHEREWMSQFIDSGMVDVFREAHPGENGHYSWWSYRGRARENNKGWRIDYHLVSDPLASKVVKSDIWAEVDFSDHCPISIKVDI